MQGLAETALGVFLLVGSGLVLAFGLWIGAKAWAHAQTFLRLLRRLLRLRSDSLRVAILEEVLADLRNRRGITLGEVYAINAILNTLRPQSTACESLVSETPAETARKASPDRTERPSLEQQVGAPLLETLDGGWILFPDSQQHPWLRSLLKDDGREAR